LSYKEGINLPIVHQNITKQIVEYFIKNIESENWKVGEKIPSENQLTAKLGVSRVSVRQAVSQLSGIGVLESIHGKGTFLIDNQVQEVLSNDNRITSKDCKDIEKVLEFRRIVESEACYMAVQNKTPELIKKLRTYLKIMIDNKDDVDKFVTADIKFHKAICKAADNPLLEKSMNKVFEENRKSQEVTRKTFGYHDGINYHKLILEAMVEGDAQRARSAMHEHLQNGMKRLKNKNVK
jgi:GntR family transcriptional repressor for pyruvate dehydrogenase complex